MNAYALTSPTADYKDLWNMINNSYGAVGITGPYVVNEAQDQSLSNYMFYMVTETSAGPEWKPIAYYRDVQFVKNDLGFITS